MKPRDVLIPVLLLAAVGLVGWLEMSASKRPPAAPAVPAPPVQPQPHCPDDRCPPKPKPWGDFQATVGGPSLADGTELQIDLPASLHQKNTGGSDGAGLCVFASMRHAGLWSDEPVFAGLFQWMKKRPGGGYPGKVDQMIARYCAEKGSPRPDYIQVEDADLGILKQACQAGLMPGVTYWRSPTGRYGGQRVSHMVSLVHADEAHFAVLDNNYTGTYEWMSPAEFARTYTGGTGRGWAVILLKPGPPPIPIP